MMKKLEDLCTPEDFAQHWLDTVYESPGVKFYLVELFERHEKLVKGMILNEMYPGKINEVNTYLNGLPVPSHAGKEL